jgi:uncharacterized membrane protein (GlpM family)
VDSKLKKNIILGIIAVISTIINVMDFHNFLSDMDNSKNIVYLPSVWGFAFSLIIVTSIYVMKKLQSKTRKFIVRTLVVITTFIAFISIAADRLIEKIMSDDLKQKNYTRTISMDKSTMFNNLAAWEKISNE